MTPSFNPSKKRSRVATTTYKDNADSSIKCNKSVVGYLLFKKVVIENANAISSPLTYGFPAVTGFLGSFHAMSRKMAVHSELNSLSLGGVLLACYECMPKVYRDQPYNNYTFNQSRNPLKKDGKTASIIEEGKCRLVMSFVVEVLSDSKPSDELINALTTQSKEWMWQQRMAGGSVFGIDRFNPVQYFDANDIDDVVPHLLPAFVLMEAKQEFSEIIDAVQQDNPDATPLDALIDVATLHHVPETKDNGETKWSIRTHSQNRGWLVPMPIGYQGISELYDAGVMQNVRNPEYPSQYVEAIYGLGKWVFPQRLGLAGSEYNLKNAFWRYQYDKDNNLYLVTQQKDD